MKDQTTAKIIMKKIAIVTIRDYNLGNRLQNYALQSFLQSMNLESRTLDCKRRYSVKVIIKLIIKEVLGFFKIGKYWINYWELKRKRVYKRFDRRYIVNGEPVHLSKPLKIDAGNYDYFITGSDQVWHNWSIGKKELQFFYLLFAEKNQRLSYAPSFGFSKFPEVDDQIHKQGLNEMRALSCREEDGCKLINNITGRKAERLIDPTFLLTMDQWMQIEEKPKWYNNKKRYLVTYFLGDFSDEYHKTVYDYAKKNKLDVINILSISKLNEYIISPTEFIFLIHNASYVCTDSFHACAFALIFHKQFVAFPRRQEGMEDMKGRIETLFSILQIEGRWYNQCDWDSKIQNSYNKLIEKEVCKSQEYLKKWIV